MKLLCKMQAGSDDFFHLFDSQFIKYHAFFYGVDSFVNHFFIPLKFCIFLYLKKVAIQGALLFFSADVLF